MRRDPGNWSRWKVRSEPNRKAPDYERTSPIPGKCATWKWEFLPGNPAAPAAQIYPGRKESLAGEPCRLKVPDWTGEIHAGEHRIAEVGQNEYFLDLKAGETVVLSKQRLPGEVPPVAGLAVQQSSNVKLAS